MSFDYMSLHNKYQDYMDNFLSPTIGAGIDADKRAKERVKKIPNDKEKIPSTFGRVKQNLQKIVEVKRNRLGTIFSSGKRINNKYVIKDLHTDLKKINEDINSKPLLSKEEHKELNEILKKMRKVIGELNKAGANSKETHNLMSQVDATLRKLPYEKMEARKKGNKEE